MTTSLPNFVVFDHDGGKLQLLSLKKQVGFSQLTVYETGNAKDKAAVERLLADSNWQMAFVHINPVPWDVLCEGASKEQVIVRFSTGGFPSTHPKGKKALCLQCTKKIDDLGNDDLKKLKDVLCDRSSCAALGGRLIPPSIRHLVAFEEPYSLRALHILMQGILSLWASDPGHEKSKAAREQLQVEKLPTMPNRAFGSRATIRQALGLKVDSDGNVPALESEVFRENIKFELGVKDFSSDAEDVAIENLIDSIVVGVGTGNLETDAVLNGFMALDQFFKKK